MVVSEPRNLELVQGGHESSAEADAGILRHEFATAEVREADDFVRTVYAQHDAHYTGPVDSFRFEAGYVHNSTFGIEYLAASGTGRIRLQPLRSLLIVNVTAGRAEIRAGRAHEDVWPGDFVLLGPNVGIEIHWDEVRVTIIRLELDAVEPIVSTLDGHRHIDPNLAITRPAGALQASHLRATVDHLRRDVLSNMAAARSGLVRRQAFWSLAAALVNTFPDVLVAADQVVPKTALLNASAIVRRACGYMDTHARDKITMGDVSRAAYVSPRTLQDAFRKHLHSTPSAYLTGVRLRGAHDDLLRMDKAHGDTVAAVAERWCFANGGRFAKLYRELFGRTPHQTLEM